MSTIQIVRGESTAIDFSISDTNGGLSGKRVTLSIADALRADPVLRKVGGLPGSTADITIVTQTSNSIEGTINISINDFDSLILDEYVMTLWVDDGSGGDRMVTPNGYDTLTILNSVPRVAP